MNKTKGRIKLVKLSHTYQSQLKEMLDEWSNYDEADHTPWAIFKNDYHDFDYYLDNLDIKSHMLEMRTANTLFTVL